MRLLAFAACLALGCSSPETTIVYVVADTGRADTGSPDDWLPDAFAAPDTYVAPLDTAAPVIDSAPEALPADTYAPPLDTSPPPPDTYVCSPKVAADVCKSTAVFGACGSRPDGCGGTVACDPCVAVRLCISSPTMAPGCGCKAVLGPLCLDAADNYSQKWECGADEVPIHPLAKLKPQPNGAITWWCVPATAY